VLAHIYNNDLKSQKSVVGLGLLIGFMAASEIVRRDNMEKEIKADAMALKWMSEEGYDTNAAISLFERLFNLFEDSEPNWINIYGGGKRRLEKLSSLVDKNIKSTRTEFIQKKEGSKKQKQTANINVIPKGTESIEVDAIGEDIFDSNEKAVGDMNTVHENKLVSTPDSDLSTEIKDRTEQTLISESSALRSRAITGDVESQYMLGEKYYKGDGVIKDYVEAYLWLNLAAANGHKTALKSREKLEKKMTPDQVAEGQKLSREWLQKHSN